MKKALSVFICFLFFSKSLFANEIVRDTSIVFINSIPNKLTVYADKSNIKKGEVVTLTTSECSGGTVFWENGSNDKVRVVSPNEGTVYNAYCSRYNCNGERGYLTINVSDSPIYVDVNNASICKGGNATLKGNGCIGNYVWSNGENGQTITVIPSQTTVYAVDCFINGVLSGNASRVVEVTEVPEKPELQYEREIVLGDSTFISAYCNMGVVWDTLNLPSNKRFNQSIWVKPTVATKYSVYCTNGTCSSDSVQFTVKVKINGIVLLDEKGKKDNITLCYGDSLKLSVKGCLSNNYSWFPKVSSTGNYNTIAEKSQLYVVVCVDAIYGNYSDTINVTVLPKPELKFTVEKSSEYIGSTVTINTSGCDAKNIVWFRESIISNAKVSYKYINQTEIDTVYFTCQGFCKSDTQAVVIKLLLLKAKPVVLTKKICEGNIIDIDSGCPNNSTVGLWVNGSMFKSDSKTISFPYVKAAKYEIACIDVVTKKESEKVNFSISGTGVDFKNLIVFPNPFDEFFKVSSDGCLDGVTIRLYDVEGRLINKNLSYINEDGLLKVFGEFLATGNYIIQIIKDNTVYATKVIIKQNLN